MAIDRRAQPVGEAGRKARTARANTWAAELAPVIAELQRAGVTSLRDIAIALTARGIPAARGGEWRVVQVERELARIKKGARTKKGAIPKGRSKSRKPAQPIE
jgi:hypothetical protein